METAQLANRLSAEAALLNTRGAADPHSDRLHPAAETVARMRPKFDRFGITRLAQVTGLDRIGIPVWMAIRPNSRTLAVSQGKGLDDAAAQASAVMEAAELATAERPSLPLRSCSAQELAADGQLVMPLNNLRGRGESPVLDMDVLSWVEGFDLIGQSSVWVPAEAVCLDQVAGITGQPGRYWQSSDGLASGTLLLEAVVHGVCERIERDAGVLWQLRSDADVFKRCVDPSAFDDEAVLSLAEQVERAGLQLRLFDMSSDIGIPVFFATISPCLDGHEAHWKHFDISSGSGCHPSPARAAIRAITEAAQSRVTSIAGARDDFDPAIYRARLKADLLTYLRAKPDGRVVRSPSSPGGPAQNLPFILQRLEQAGIGSVIVVPLEADEPGFAVAKVLVPELEHPPGERRQRFGRRALKAMAGLQ